jgi:hypothetical protein
MMSKQIIRILALFLILTLVATTMVFVAAAGAATPQSPGAAATTTRNAAIVAATTTVLKETSEIRELSILREVKSGAQSRSEIERMVIKNLDEQATPAEMHASETALKKLGLVPPEFRYRDFIIKLLAEQVAGYYDAKTKQFYLADWIELEGQKPVMAHELTHALQDQHFNLRRFENWPKGDSDAELAAQALIEGDATLAMTLYLARNPLVAFAFMRSLGVTTNSSEQFKQAPRVVRESLVFPYEHGSEWATRLYKRGGWAMVSAAFDQLPQSTEQILHPEKYFAREAPTKVSLPELRTLGPTWRKIDYDVNGEWSYYLILDQFLANAAESKRAAAGWAGDRYALYEEPKSASILLVQLSAWDTDEDAQEFFDAYIKRSEQRYPGANEESNSPTSRLWGTTEGQVLMEIRGRRALIIEGIPDSVNARTLATTVWNQAR